jgi:hypothetical protein
VTLDYAWWLFDGFAVCGVITHWVVRRHFRKERDRLTSPILAVLVDGQPRGVVAIVEILRNAGVDAGQAGVRHTLQCMEEIDALTSFRQEDPATLEVRGGIPRRVWRIRPKFLIESAKKFGFIE